MSAVLTVKQLAGRWHCETRQINEMACAKEIPAFKVGRHWRFREDAIEAHEQRGAPAIAPPIDFAAGLKRRRTS